MLLREALQGLERGLWEVSGGVVTVLLLNPKQAEMPHGWCRPDTHPQILGQLALLWTGPAPNLPCETEACGHISTEHRVITLDPFISLEILKGSLQGWDCSFHGNVALMFTHTESL